MATSKIRAGVYRRYVDIGKRSMVSRFISQKEDSKEEKAEITYAFDGKGNVLLNIPGAHISWDGKGNVLITGLNARIAYNNGNVYIGE